MTQLIRYGKLQNKDYTANKHIMKKILFFIAISLLLAGCSKDDDTDEAKYCWNFQIRVMTTIYSGTEKTSSVVTNEIICDLTEAEANEMKEKIYNVSEGSKGGYRVKIVTEVINLSKKRDNSNGNSQYDRGDWS